MKTIIHGGYICLEFTSLNMHIFEEPRNKSD